MFRGMFYFFYFIFITFSALNTLVFVDAILYVAFSFHRCAWLAMYDKYAVEMAISQTSIAVVRSVWRASRAFSRCNCNPSDYKNIFFLLLVFV